MQNKTIYRSEYKPFPFSVSSLELSVDLYEDHALVTSHIAFKREHLGELHLSGDELELISVHLDSHELPKNAYQLSEGDLIIPSCPDEFTLSTNEDFLKKVGKR